MRRTVGLVGVLCLLSAIPTGCTFRGSTNSTVDTTENITISTSGTNALLRDHQRVLAFVSDNPENLERDIVRAEGEYLYSLSELLRVRPEQREAFARHLQQSYPMLVTGLSGDRRAFGEQLVRLADEGGYSPQFTWATDSASQQPLD